LMVASVLAVTLSFRPIVCPNGSVSIKQAMSTGCPG
jgi:hypothetical protein